MSLPPAGGARTALALALSALALAHACAAAPASTPRAGGAAAGERPFVVRPFRPWLDGRWIGVGIAYGPHRDGQRPGGPSPSRAEVREDLRRIAGHWNLLRLYGSVGPADTVLEAIRVERLPIRVVLGAWIAPEDRRDSTGRVIESLPDARAANRAEIEAAVRLARAYPDLVVAISVGNETQVSWSAHRVPASLLVDFVREVRARTAAPVTTADDFGYWTTPSSRDLARELDFVLAHAHPLWNGRQAEDAAAWTRSVLDRVRRIHRDRLVVLGETGWATAKLDTGEQATLMKGRVGEEEQARVCRDIERWVRGARVPAFFFEAFDENWKGGPDPRDAEKHWGFFRADRSPKRVLLASRPH